MECPSFPEITSSEWAERVFGPMKGQRYPLSGSIDLTERCNLNCVHCYINQPAASVNARTNEMSTAQVFNVLDQVSDAGCLFLMLTGGEILVRQDFADIYQHARRRGLILTLFTNGTLVSEKIADTLALSPPRIIEITLYGATQHTYEAVTQVKGSYQRCMHGIETLLDRGLKVMLKSVILKSNMHELEQMKKLAQDYGSSFRYDATLWPRIDGDTLPYTERLSIEEQLAQDLADPERMQAWLDEIGNENSSFYRSGKVFNCGAGFRSFHINAAGKLTMCIMLRQPAYDLFELGFSQAWELLGVERERQRQLHTHCETCNLGSLCSQCPGWSQVVHGDLETPVDFICELAHERSKILEKSGKITSISEEDIIYG